MTVFSVTSQRVEARGQDLPRPDRFGLLRHLNDAPWYLGEATLYVLPDFGHLKRFQHFEYPKRSKGLSIPLLSVVPVNSPPTTPADLVAAPQGETQVDLSWTASTTDAGYFIAQYNVYQDGVLIAAPTGTTYNVTGLDPWTSYTFTVEAVDNRPLVSTQSSVTVRTLDTTSPTSFEITLTPARTSIDASWTDATDSGSGMSGYTLTLNDVEIVTQATTSYTFTGLTPGTDYVVVVTAQDLAGNQTGVIANTTTLTGTIYSLPDDRTVFIGAENRTVVC